MCEVVEELPGRGFERLFLKGDGRVAEARSELQRVDAGVVDDTVDVDTPDVSFFSELDFEFTERLLEQSVPPAPEHRRPHLAR